jgi:hypothetical protein
MASKVKGVNFITDEGRLSFCNVFKPFAGKAGDKPKYMCDFLWPKTNEAFTNRLIAAMMEAAENGREWLGLGPTDPIALKNIKHPVKDGDTKAAKYPEYAGMYFINASAAEDKKPEVCDLSGRILMTEQEFYSGCYGRLDLNIVVWDPAKAKGNRGVGAYLNNVLKTKDGMALGGVRKSAQESFQELIKAGNPAAATGASSSLF